VDPTSRVKTLAKRLGVPTGYGTDVGTQNQSIREQWLAAALAAIPSGERILDAGAGELQYAHFCAHLDYVSQDLGQYDGKGDDVGLQMKSWDNSRLDIVSDIASIPVPDSSFDAVMCVEVLEHVPHPTEAIREFARITRPGGTLVITVPVSSLTHFAPYYFYNGFSRYYFERVLSEVGFEIVELVHNGNYFEAMAQELRRLESVRAMYASRVKPATVLDKLAVRRALRRLASMSAVDSGSAELSSHGIGVVARRSP
jgi:ubiquinone/menaquinone biosynthesis C-methylase UbiE